MAKTPWIIAILILGSISLRESIAEANEDIHIVNLRCEYRVDPIGIAATTPRLSWILESHVRGQLQTAYQIYVARKPEFLEEPDLWDSGKVVSDQTTHVIYRGERLKTGERAWWRVRVWDKNGKASTSPVAYWEMGLLDRSDWRAQWIGLRTRDPIPFPELDKKNLHWIASPDMDPIHGAPVGIRHYRKEFVVPQGEIKSAGVWITADDIFELTVNSIFVSRGVAWQRFYFIDLTDRLQSGNNDIDIAVTNFNGVSGAIAQFHVEFTSGHKIVMATDATWTVSSKLGAEGNATPVREIARLGQQPWAALTGDDLQYPHRPEPSPFLRKDFMLSNKVKRARLYATALGLYEVHLNGQRVGKSYFSPGWTDYEKRIEYQSYDVTDALRHGQNIIGAVLGDGWYAGRVGWLQSGNNYGPYPLRLLLQMEIEYANGGHQTIVSDGSWKGASGPILKSDIMDGESYDARLELDGWSNPASIRTVNQASGDVQVMQHRKQMRRINETDRGRDADSAGTDWRAVQVFPEISSRIVPQISENVQVTQYLKPIRRTQPAPGVYVFDLGQNITGWVRLKVRGDSGRKITLRFAETLDSDGTLYTWNLCTARATDQYILKGGKEETYEPRFTYHGFRYVEITGYPRVPDDNAVLGCVVHSALEITGLFECSNPMINQLQSNIVWSQRGNFFSVPTDCPQRDERLGWMGDAQIFARTACFNMNVAPFFSKWMRDVDEAQSSSGAFSIVAPRIVSPSDSLPAWSDAGIIVPWTIYSCYADTRILEEHYEAMKKWIDYIHTANAEMLWLNHRGADLGDWLNVNAETPREVLATAFFAYDARLLSNTAGVLGKPEDQRKYGKLAEAIRKAFQKSFVTAEGEIKGDTQTGYALAIAFDLLPTDLRESAAKHLVADIEKKGHLSTGFVGVSYLLPALTYTGHLVTAYQLLLNDTAPSWGFHIKQGATTIWEQWDGWRPGRGIMTPGLNSLNHYAYGSVGEWLYSVVAGIDLDLAAPGYKRVIIRPRPGGGLTYAKGELRSMNGNISVHWKIDAGRFIAKICIPPNTTATVYIPSLSEVLEGGRPASQSEGVEFIKKEGGCTVFKVKSGLYEFSSNLDVNRCAKLTHTP